MKKSSKKEEVNHTYIRNMNMKNTLIITIVGAALAANVAVAGSCGSKA